MFGQFRQVGARDLARRMLDIFADSEPVRRRNDFVDAVLGAGGALVPMRR